LAPLVDFVDMDGTLLQNEQFGEGVNFDFGKIIYNNLPGLGVKVEPF